MIDSPFEVGNMCCSIMKKHPLADYTKKTGRHPITAQMAQESMQRTTQWLKFGCNMYDNKRPISNPMSFWTEQDVLEYIKENNLPICSVYGSVIREEDEVEGQMSIEDYLGGEKRGRLTTTGYKRTGCVFCLYGAHLNKDQRLVKLKETHPKLYEYVMKPECQGGLGYEEKIKYLKEHGINIEY